MKDNPFIGPGRRTVEIERDAIAALSKRIDGNFAKACQLILNGKGRTVVSGMGKSGHIGKKIAATLASTGTPSLFVHPAEASHGDLGMITKSDVVIAISYSGTSTEVITLLPLLKRMGIPLISMTCDDESTLAQAADVNLNISVECEACPLDLAPTSSTTATLVMGDALAVALLQARGFTAEDFAFSHPGGTLGKKLLLKVEDIMHRGGEVPRVTEDTPLTRALIEMTQKGLGMTSVVNKDEELIGVFTDGDLRRNVDAGIDIGTALMAEVMTPNPTTVNKDMLAAGALGLMESKKITALIVEDSQHRPIGVVHMHDILRSGVV